MLSLARSKDKKDPDLELLIQVLKEKYRGGVTKEKLNEMIELEYSSINEIKEHYQKLVSQQNPLWRRKGNQYCNKDINIYIQFYITCIKYKYDYDEKMKYIAILFNSNSSSQNVKEAREYLMNTDRYHNATHFVKNLKIFHTPKAPLDMWNTSLKDLEHLLEKYVEDYNNNLSNNTIYEITNNIIVFLTDFVDILIQYNIEPNPGIQTVFNQELTNIYETFINVGPNTQKIYRIIKAANNLIIENFIHKRGLSAMVDLNNNILSSQLPKLSSVWMGKFKSRYLKTFYALINIRTLLLSLSETDISNIVRMENQIQNYSEDFVIPYAVPRGHQRTSPRYNTRSRSTSPTILPAGPAIPARGFIVPPSSALRQSQPYVPRSYNSSSSSSNASSRLSSNGGKKNAKVGTDKKKVSNNKNKTKSVGNKRKASC